MTLPSLIDDVRRALAEGYIRIMHLVLMRRPDGQVFESAFTEGMRGIQDARKLGRSTLEGEYHNWLGTLALDAYGSNFGPTELYPGQIQEWLARASEPMPSPPEGLRLACRHLESALNLREPGPMLGRTAKALLEAEIYLAYALGTKIDPERAEFLADWGLSNLDPVEDKAHVARIHQLMSRFASTESQ